MRDQWCNQIGGSDNGNVNVTLSLRISIEAENHQNYDRTFQKNQLPWDLNFSGPNTQEPSYIGAENGGAGDPNFIFTSLVNNKTATGGFINGNYYDGHSSTAAANSHLITAMLPMIPNASAQEIMSPAVSRERALQQEYFAAAPPPSPLIPDLNVEFRPEDNSAADAPPPPPPSPLIPDLNVEFRLEDNSTADATLPNSTVNVPAEESTDAVVEVRVPRTRRKRSTEVIYNDPSRKCKDCNIKDTPMWRRGPLGPKTLCNACGIHYRKEEQKNKKARSEAAAANN